MIPEYSDCCLPFLVGLDTGPRPLAPFELSGFANIKLRTFIQMRVPTVSRMT